MKKSRFAVVATFLALFTMLVGASPASAVTGSAFRDNFYAACDGYVYVSTNNVPGTVSAWGGYWGCNANVSGFVRINLYRNGVFVTSATSPLRSADQNVASLRVNNPAGTQTWKSQATIILSPGVAEIIFSSSSIAA
jgi:hypothetical protein